MICNVVAISQIQLEIARRPNKPAAARTYSPFSINQADKNRRTALPSRRHVSVTRETIVKRFIQNQSLTTQLIALGAICIVLPLSAMVLMMWMSLNQAAPAFPLPLVFRAL